MLQSAALTERLVAEYERHAEFPPSWASMEELERTVDAWVARLRRDRRAAARGVFGRLGAALDARMRTDTVEYFDRGLAPAEQAAMARELHIFNVAIGSYRTFLRALLPHLERVHRETGRPARLLELACGSGEFTLRLAEMARGQSVPVRVTGSDIRERYVEDGNARAAERGLEAGFVRVNAFDMSNLEAGSFDVVFIAQSVHHFTPGQIAMVVAQARRIAPAAFVAIDGYRSLHVLAGAPFVGVWPLRRSARLSYRLTHDALVSARKFLSGPELAFIARIAAPEARASSRRLAAFHTALEVTPADR